MTPPKRLVLAVVPDLFFAVRISATARNVGVPLELVPPPRAVARAAQAGAVLLHNRSQPKLFATAAGVNDLAHPGLGEAPGPNRL